MGPVLLTFALLFTVGSIVHAAYRGRVNITLAGASAGAGLAMVAALFASFNVLDTSEDGLTPPPSPIVVVSDQAWSPAAPTDTSPYRPLQTSGLAQSSSPPQASNPVPSDDPAQPSNSTPPDNPVQPRDTDTVGDLDDARPDDGDRDDQSNNDQDGDRDDDPDDEQDDEEDDEQDDDQDPDRDDDD